MERIYPPYAGMDEYYDLLVAHYTIKRDPIIPNGWEKWKIWQFSENFMMQGCKEYCDGDWFNGTLDECRDWFGNYRPMDNELPEPPPHSYALPMVSVVDGLRIRSAPSINADIVGSLDDGELIYVTDVSGG